MATRIYYPETKEIQFEHGYRLGQVDKDNVYINNHLKFILSYHKHTEWVLLCKWVECRIPNNGFPTPLFRDKYRVVGFEVETMSVDLSEIKFEGDTCNFPDAPRPQAVRSIDCVQVDNMYFYSSDLYSRSMGMQTISFILLTQSSSSLRRWAGPVAGTLTWGWAMYKFIGLASLTHW